MVTTPTPSTSTDTGPLDWRIAITDSGGRPTPEFQRRWNTQRNNNDLIGATVDHGAPTGTPVSDGLVYIDEDTTPATEYVSVGGNWVQVSAIKFTDLQDAPHNYTSAGSKLVTVNPGATALQFSTFQSYLDAIGSARGDILYRGSTGWTALTPGTSGNVLTTHGTGADPTWTAPATGTGTVSSVALTAPSIFSVSGSPITTSGTLALSLATQSPNLVFSGPVSGSAATPTFRSLVAADLPLATTSTFGAVKPDGTTITISSGVISAVSSGSTGSKAYFGSGVPSTLHNDGDLYFDTSTTPYTGYVQNLVSSGAGSAPILVQQIANSSHSGSPALVLPSTPTVGNLIICNLTVGLGSTTLDTGWTAFDTITTSDMIGIIAYRYVQTGDTATLPNLIASGASDIAAVAYEVSGVAGTITGAVDQHKMNSSAAATTLTSSGITTGTSNTLVFTIGGCQIFFGSSPTITPSGWTIDTIPSALDNATGAAHQTVSATGTTLTPTWTWTATPTGHNVMGIISLTGGATFTHQWEVFSQDATTLAAAEAFSANASNLSSGTVPAARLPNPTASTLGGVESLAAVSHNFLTSITTSGVPIAAQPASTDISDIVATTTWTPTDGSGAGLTFSAVSAVYNRIGSMVFCSVRLTFPTTVNTSATVISSLPFTANSNAATIGAMTPVYLFGTPLAGGSALFLPTPGTTSGQFYLSNGGSQVTNASLSGTTLFFSIIYPKA